MGTFRIVVNRGKHYAASDVDDMYVDDDRIILDTVRNLIYELTVAKNVSFSEFGKRPSGYIEEPTHDAETCASPMICDLHGLP